MSHALGQTANSVKSDRPMSRLDANREDLLSMIRQMEHSNERLLKHLTVLGYFHPEPSQNSAPIAPYTEPATLHDAIKALDARVDQFSGMLNLFD